jgi:hypothetical protein
MRTLSRNTLTFMSNRVVRRIIEFVAAVALLGWVVSLLTPLGKSWEWLLAAGSLIMFYVCVRVLSRLASRDGNVKQLNRPGRKL